jgi:hypothetical protein
VSYWILESYCTGELLNPWNLFFGWVFLFAFFGFIFCLVAEKTEEKSKN